MRNRLAAFALLALSACGGGDSPTDPPKETPIDYSRLSLTVVSGDAQTDTVMRELQPIAVEIKAADGRPVPGIGVNFVVPETYSCGTVFAGSAVTNANGRAMERWTLGHTARQCTLEVRAVHPETGAAIVFKSFTATALPDSFAGSMTTDPPQGSLPYTSTLFPADRWGNAIQSFRLEAPAGAPLRVQGTVEGTPEARTLVRVDSLGWSRTKPLGNYSYTGDVNPYPNDPVRLKLYISGVLQTRVVCAGQGRASGGIVRADRIELRLALNWADPTVSHVCQSFF